MVQQLLTLVTVNRLLSEAAKVFYGPYTPSRLCRGSVRFHTLEESRATDGLAFRAAELSFSCRPSFPPFSPHPLLFTSCSFDSPPFTSPLSVSGPTDLGWFLSASAWESCASYLWTDFASGHWEGTSIRLVPFTKKRWEEDMYGRIKK